MNVDVRDTTVLMSLKPLEIAMYLRASGWTEVQRITSQDLVQALVWQKSLGTDLEFEIVLPMDRRLRDFAARMYDMLSTLALAESRSQLEIVSDLNLSSYDIVRNRALAASADEGTILLDDGVRFVQHAKEMMWSAACAAVQPRGYYHSRRPQQAVDYMKKVRMGQTERGSYVVTVLSRVPPALVNPDTNQIDMIEEPFPRQVTATLATALRATHDAARIAASNGDLQAFQEAVPRGVSANLCDAISGMSVELDDSPGLEIGITWSRVRPSTQPLYRKLTFGVDTIAVIQEAGRSLRAIAADEEIEYRGFVTKLSRDDATAGGMVAIAGVVEDSMRRVQVDLPREDYEAAIVAHRHGLPVSVVGELHKTGRAWVLSRPRNFQAVAETED
jgi:hypothetical protein